MSKILWKSMHLAHFCNLLSLSTSKQGTWVKVPNWWVKFLPCDIRRYISLSAKKYLAEKFSGRNSICLFRKGSLTGSSPKWGVFDGQWKESKLFQEIHSFSTFHHDNSWGLLFLFISFLQLFIHTLHQTLTLLVLFNSLYSIYHASQRKTNQISTLLFWQPETTKKDFSQL